ncbi:MAG: tetratricopeptide repeat protein [Candidatus Obscuribacter sp.]|nr:tetratricopeptide repeat protein [Candidatus Obscuribacter sp.]
MSENHSLNVSALNVSAVKPAKRLVLSLSLSLVMLSGLAVTSLSLCLPAPADAQTGAEQSEGLPIKDIKVDGSGQLVIVFATGGAFPEAPRVAELDSPRRIVMDFQDAALEVGSLPSVDALSASLTRAVPGIKGIRYSMVGVGAGGARPIARIVLELDAAAPVKAKVAKVEEGAVTVSLLDDAAGGNSSATAGGATAASDKDAYDDYYKQLLNQKEADKKASAEWGPRRGSLSEVGGKVAIKPITNVSNWMGGFWGKKDQGDAAAATKKPESKAPAASSVAEPAQRAASNESTAQTKAPEQSLLSKGLGVGKLWKRGKAASTTPQPQSQPAEASTAPAEAPTSATAGTSPTAENVETGAAAKSASGEGGWGEWGDGNKTSQTNPAQEKPVQAEAPAPVTPVESPTAAAPEPTPAPETKAAGAGEVGTPQTQADASVGNSDAANSETPSSPLESASGETGASETPRYKAGKLFNKAVHQHLSGNLAEAIKDYQAAVGIDPELGQAYCNLGLAYNQQHNYADALAAFRKALAVNASDAIAYNGIGAALKAQKDMVGATKNWQTAVKLNPKLGVAQYNLGTAYEFQGEFEKALVAYQAAIKCDSRMGEAYYRIGLIMQKQKKLDEARSQFKQALKLSGNSEYSEDARQRLALIDKKVK